MRSKEIILRRKIELVDKINEKYLEAVYSAEEEVCNLRVCFRHLARNYLNIMVATKSNLERVGKLSERLFNNYVEIVNALNLYMKLIKENGGFRRKEFYEEDGYFPEFPKHNIEMREYPYRAEIELNKKGK